MAGLLHRLAVRERADRCTGVDRQVRPVRVERSDDVLVGDGAVRVMASHRLRVHLPGDQESARRRTRARLARAEPRVKRRCGGDERMTDVSEEFSTDTRNIEFRRHVPGDPSMWFFVIGDLIIFGVYFVAYMYYRGEDHAMFLQSQA